MTAQLAPSAQGMTTRDARPGRGRRPGRILLLAALVVSTLATLTPFFWTISTSLKRSEDVFGPGSGLIPNPLTLNGYREVFTLVPFAHYFANSVVVAVLVLVGNVLFDTAAAYAFAKLRFPGRSVLFGILLVSLMVPMQVNLIPLYRIMVSLHQTVPALGANTLSGIVLPSIVQVFGIFLMRQYFSTIPDSIIEAARIDGAGELTILRRIVFPIAAPGIATLTIFTFLTTWNDFLWPLIVAGTDSSRTLPVGLALLARKNTVNWPDTMAGAVITAVPMIVIFVLMQRRFIEGLTAGAAKDL
jgi:ABC-type glycerol-3-phosphate transport system permease component